MEDFKSQIEEIKQELSKKYNKILSLENDLILLKKSYQIHGHTGGDGTRIIDSELNLKPEQPIKLGFGGLLTTSNSASVPPGTAGEQIQASFVSGKDMGGGVGQTTNNLQLNLLHQPQNASNQSFITAFRPPLYTPIPGTTITVTATQNTVTINGHNFSTDVLVGALINIFSSTGTFIETQVIESNTSNIITIVDVWGATTTGGSFVIFVPVYLGSADTPFQRVYVQEGTAGGVRFGTGVTNGGQNALLYVDGADLKFRKKDGTVTTVTVT